MNNNYSIEQQYIINTLTNLLYELNLDLDIFYRNLRKHYVYKVYNSCHNATRTALRCGIDRRIVAAILKNKKLYHKRAILPMIIDAIRTRTDSGNKLLLKRGSNSLVTIIQKTANGATTVNTVLDVLSSIGIIENHGTKIKFIDYPLYSAETQQSIHQFAISFDQLMVKLTAELKSIKKNSDD